MHLNGNANSHCFFRGFPLLFQFELQPKRGGNATTFSLPLSAIRDLCPESSKNKSTTGSILTLHCQWSVKTQQKLEKRKKLRKTQTKTEPESQEQSVVTRMWVSAR